MKKLFLSFMLFAASFNLFAAGMHVPAVGPVQLGDAVNGQQGVLRGAIMKAIVDNNPANPNTNPILAAANIAIAQFDGQGQHFRAYQAIMTNISQSTNTQAAIEAVKAFENVIMHLYDYDTYLVGGYKSGISIFLPTGVRWSWIKPWCYFSPKSYFSDNDARSKQLIDELDKLADVARIHSIVEYVRIKATVQSYRNWRRNVMLSIAAYLAADACRHGYDKSIINQFYQGGLENAGEMAINHLLNFRDAAKCVGFGLYKTAHGLCKAGGKVCGVMLHGKKAFEKNNDQSKINDKKTNKNSASSSSVSSEQVSLNVPDKKATPAQVSVGVQVDLQNQSTQEKKESVGIFQSIGNMIAYQVHERQKRKEIWNDRLKRLKNESSSLYAATPSMQGLVKAQHNAVQEKIQNIETQNKVVEQVAQSANKFVNGCFVDQNQQSTPSKSDRKTIKEKIAKIFFANIEKQHKENQAWKKGFFDGLSLVKKHFFYTEQERKEMKID